MPGESGLAPEVTSRVFGAARAELVESGIDGFSVDRVALRAGVDPALIRRRWNDRRVLLIEASRTAMGRARRDYADQMIDIFLHGTLRMLGYDIPTMLTMKWRDFTAPESVAEETEIVAEILAGRRDSHRAVKQYVHADGHRVWADLSLSCIRRPDGEVENLIAQIIDISEFRKAGQW